MNHECCLFSAEQDNMHLVKYHESTFAEGMKIA